MRDAVSLSPWRCGLGWALRKRRRGGQALKIAASQRQVAARAAFDATSGIAH